MSHPLTPTALHETLDRSGYLDDVMGPGVYALEVDTPGGAEAVARRFLAVADVTPRDGDMERLTSDSVAYVGASSNVYARLMDHMEGEVRQALFLEAFDVTGLIGVWPCDEPFEEEFNRSVELSEEGWVCYCDGRVV